MLKKFSVFGVVLIAIFSFALMGCGNDNQKAAAPEKPPASTKPYAELTKTDKMSVEHLNEYRKKIANNKKSDLRAKEVLLSILDEHIKNDDRPTKEQITTELNDEMNKDLHGPLSIHWLRAMRALRKEQAQEAIKSASPEEVKDLKKGEEIVLSIIDKHIKADDKPTADQVDSECKAAIEKATSHSTQGQGYTMAQFRKIKDGMTYKQVVKILGNEGTLFSEMGDAKTYNWTDGNTNISVGFYQGRVNGKMQVGLK